MHLEQQAAVQNLQEVSVPARKKRRFQILYLRRFWTILLIPLSMLMVSIASSWPALTERVYAQGVYPVLSGVFGRLTSLAPFSLAEGLVFLLPLALLTYVVRQILRAVAQPKKRRKHLACLAATLICIGSVGLFLFQALCGLNYHRESFAVTGGLEVRPSSVLELEALCSDLLRQANTLRTKVSEDEFGVMRSTYLAYTEAAEDVRHAYASLSKQYPQLGGHTVTPKPVALSRGMSYLDITGVYMPFTFEANVNVDVPAFWVPSTILHEVAHSKGYMREDEANFVSYLACIASERSDFAYSGTVLALVHSTNALYAVDQERYWALREQYSEGLRRDLAASSVYWKQFEGPVATASTAVNNAYLRSNHQAEGVRSYGRMVDLLLARYRQQQETEMQ